MNRQTGSRFAPAECVFLSYSRETFRDVMRVFLGLIPAIQGSHSRAGM